MGSERPSSVMLARDPEVLQTMLGFYAPNARQIIDCTANERRMWKGVASDRVTFMDIDPAMSPDIVGDFCDMPFDASSLDVIVFDPPHLPAAAASAASDHGFAGRYGLQHGGGGSNISHFFGPFLAEAQRVLRADGLIFAKLKDFVHNHSYQWTLADFIQAVRDQDGLTACDLIVKRDPSAGNMMSGKWKKAHHVRNAHCWWVIVRKGRCEARK
jgi:hypothetical protein